MTQYSVRTCTQCNARRRIYTVDIVGHIHNMRCSKGHTWADNFAKTNQIMKDIWSDYIAETINNDTPLMAYIKRAT